MISEPLADLANSIEPVTSSADTPIFIVGMSRSGTTLLSRMLDAHSEIAILPETWMYVALDRMGCSNEFRNSWQTSLFFNEVWRNLKSYRDPAARVVAREAAREGRYVGPTFRILEKLGRAYARERHASVWGEKTPGHALWLPQIRALFPQARVLFMVRDPRDVLVSYDDRWDEGKRETEYLISTAALLKYYLNRLLHSPAFPPEQIHCVRYEFLTTDPGAELKRICDFVGLSFEPSMLAFYDGHSKIAQEMAEGQHHALLSRPATTERIGRYRAAFSPSQIALVERLLGEEMKALGYPLSESRDISFSPQEEKSFARAEQHYQRMAAGEIRKRFRRKGSLKVRAYRILGPVLGMVPSWRVAHSQTDWEKLEEGTATRSIPDPNPPVPIHGSTGSGSEKTSFRTEMGRISRQSGVAFAGTIFTAILGYAFKIYLARFLGAEALGMYALGMTIVGFLGVVNVLGIPESALRFVAAYSATGKIQQLRALLWNGSWILLATNLILSLVLLKAGPWAVARFYHVPQLARYLPLFALIMLTSALNLFFGNVLAGYRQVARRTIISRFVSSPVTILASLVLITAGYGLGGYLAAQIVSATCVLALLITWVWRLTPVDARSPIGKLSMDREVWSFSAAMFGIGLIHFFMVQTDRIALGVFRGAHDVGIYAVVISLIAYETIFLQSVNQIFAPVIADIHSRGEQAVLGRLFQTLTKWILGLTLPLTIVIICYAQPIMRIFGHDFEAGWPVLVVGTCGQLVNCGVGSVGLLLFMSGNERRLLRVQLVMAVVMVVLCFKLVPLWGALGAGIAAAITNVGVNVWNLVEVRNSLKLSPYNRSYLRLLPSAGSAVLIVLLLSRVPIFGSARLLGVLVALIAAYGIFGGVTLLMGLDDDDRLIINAVASRLRTIFSSNQSPS